ncbi:hypothetical protein JNUCC31_28850 [Paenibacillus sp. JNUCC31]|uniref:hypothetical protein n=1 Tax=Paenibacillus sp. JNUCC-31 TaxID=2777983 RepID=UPI00177F8B74|nr:hypothetical protein [Paenibacillus sp. JNUCC-31]QOS78663.1 hypothetical protein JNUCC31_28850 [Paenibacillus sp. JNUCC-31]
MKMNPHSATSQSPQHQSHKLNYKWKQTVASIMLIASLSFTTFTSVSAEGKPSYNPLSPQETESFQNWCCSERLSGWHSQ